MPCRKKKSAAWKKLIAKSRPKRVKLPQERRKKGYDPLCDATMHKKVLISLEFGVTHKHLVVIMFKSVFRKLYMKQGKTYDFNRDQLTSGAKALRKIFESAKDNDFNCKMFEEKKLNNVVGRCFVLYGKHIGDADARLRILPTLKEQERAAKSRERVEKIFMRGY